MSDENIFVMTAGALPIYCVTIPKVGCTYLKNVFFHLANGEVFDEPMRIHARHDALERVTKIQEVPVDTVAKGVGFFVVRDPVDRFLSLYFDKVYGKGPQAFSWIARRLATYRTFIDGPNLTLEEHQQNCVSLAGFLGFQMNRYMSAELNPHWRPQFETASYAASFGLTPLLLDDLDAQLLQIAGGRIEGLEDAMAAASERNTSTKPFTHAEMVTPEIEHLISTLYAADRALYEKVKANWADPDLHQK